MSDFETSRDFKKRVTNALARIDKSALDYYEDEFWMIRYPYEFMQHYAHKHRLFNTAIALPLARGLHNGVYRKIPVIRGGIPHKPPYVLHCLTVCKMLADLWLPITDDEKDILLAAALCHDMIEDIAFKEGGRELYTRFELDKRVYDIVKLVSKRSDFTIEEEQQFFRNIMENRFALLIKLSDRGHNVTDLYNMSEKKIREYIGETRTYFIPMCEYARAHYPELDTVTEIMQDQINCLTKTVEIMNRKYEDTRLKLEKELQDLRSENAALHDKLDLIAKRGYGDE